MQIVYNTFTDDFDYVGTGGGPSGDDLHVARYIVGAGGTAQGANYTDLPTAYAAAVSAGGNQTVFLQPGTYNIGTMVLSPNVGITAFDCDGVIPNVVVSGKMTANFTGICAFSGIYFVNNADNILAVTGSGSCQIRFIDCWIQVGGNAFAISNSNSSCAVTFETCQGDITGTSAYFDFSAGAVNVNNSFFFNGIESSTANNFTTSSIGIESSVFNSPISKVGLGGLSLLNTSMICLNDTCITIGAAVNSDLVIYNCHIDSNNATAITIAAGNILTIANSTVGSSATDAITGAGTLRYSPISFTKSSSSVVVSSMQPIRFGPSISPIMPDTNGTVYYDGTIITTVDPGTAGDVLTSNGAGSPPSYQAAGSGTATAFRAHLNANTADNITGDGTAVIVPFDTEDYDIGSGYNPATSTYTVPAGKGGIYQINYTVFTYRLGGTNSVELLNILINGATTVRNYEVNYDNVQVSGEITLTSGAQYQLADGDTVQIQCNVAGNGSKNIGFAGTYCVFSMTKIG